MAGGLRTARRAGGLAGALTGVDGAARGAPAVAAMSGEGAAMAGRAGPNAAVQTIAAERRQQEVSCRWYGRCIVVGRISVSPSDITGNSSGKPPAS